MHRLLLFSMVCLAIGLTVARQDKDGMRFNKRDPQPHFEPKRFRAEKKLSEFCANTTLTQVYLTKMRSVIGELQANSSYNPILKSRWENFVKYIQDSANQELLHTDCASFIQGLKAAKKADQEIEIAEKKLAKIIGKQLKQVIYNVNNGKDFQELDN